MLVCPAFSSAPFKAVFARGVVVLKFVAFVVEIVVVLVCTAAIVLAIRPELLLLVAALLGEYL